VGRSLRNRPSRVKRDFAVQACAADCQKARRASRGHGHVSLFKRNLTGRTSWLGHHLGWKRLDSLPTICFAPPTIADKTNGTGSKQNECTWFGRGCDVQRKNRAIPVGAAAGGCPIQGAAAERQTGFGILAVAAVNLEEGGLFRPESETATGISSARIGKGPESHEETRRKLVYASRFRFPDSGNIFDNSPIFPKKPGIWFHRRPSYLLHRLTTWSDSFRGTSDRRPTQNWRPCRPTPTKPTNVDHAARGARSVPDGVRGRQLTIMNNPGAIRVVP